MIDSLMNEEFERLDIKGYTNAHSFRERYITETMKAIFVR